MTLAGKLMFDTSAELAGFSQEARGEGRSVCKSLSLGLTVKRSWHLSGSFLSVLRALVCYARPLKSLERTLEKFKAYGTVNYHDLLPTPADGIYAVTGKATR